MCVHINRTKTTSFSSSTFAEVCITREKERDDKTNKNSINRTSSKPATCTISDGADDCCGCVGAITDGSLNDWESTDDGAAPLACDTSNNA